MPFILTMGMEMLLTLLNLQKKMIRGQLSREYSKKLSLSYSRITYAFVQLSMIHQQMYTLTKWSLSYRYQGLHLSWCLLVCISSLCIKICTFTLSSTVVGHLLYILKTKKIGCVCLKLLNLEFLLCTDQATVMNNCKNDPRNWTNQVTQLLLH